MPDKSKPSPWITGIVDTFVGAEIIAQSQIPHRNRLVVILIDSAFETACRAFLRYKAKISLSDNHKRRENLISTVKSKIKDVDNEVWDNIDFYYEEIRCDFYHESAGKTITDVALLDYRDTVEFVIEKALGVSIRSAVGAEMAKFKASSEAAKDPSAGNAVRLSPLKARDRVEKLLIVVSAINPATVDEVNEFLKKAGDSLRLKNEEFTNILARNSGSKRLFFFNKQSGKWELSGLGTFKLNQLTTETNNG